MKILLIACTRRAYALARELMEKWRITKPENQVSCKVKCSSLPEISEEKTLTECVGEWFGQADALVFLSAAGIAVRSIAPHIRHKSMDPAVVVVDETGKYSISLLSGHHGGANELAEEIAGLLGAEAVITTATDREKKFAVDVFAKRNNLKITDWELAKKISAEVLEGRKVYFSSQLPLEGKVPEELEICRTWEAIVEKPAEMLTEGVKTVQPEEASGNRQLGIWISNGRKCEPPLENTDFQWQKVQASFWDSMDDAEILQLIPRNIYLGIGCKKKTPAEKVQAAVTAALEKAGILPEAVACAASIDLKKEEPGLLAFCEENKFPFRTFSAEELRAVKGSRSTSDFVEQVTGVDNVCERSALAASKGTLLLEKQVYEGVTVAIAEKEEKVRFI